MTNVTVDNYTSKNVFLVLPQSITNIGKGNQVFDGDINNFENNTNSFVAQVLADLFLADKPVVQHTMKVLLCTDDDTVPFVNYKDILEKNKEDIIVQYEQVVRTEYIYENTSKENPTRLNVIYETNYIDYSYLLGLIRANDLDLHISENEENKIVFNISWADKNRFEELDIPKVKSLHEIEPF